MVDKPKDHAYKPVVTSEEAYPGSAHANKMPGNHDPESGSSVSMKEKIRKWEVFPGRNRFYCNGFLMLSSQPGIFYFAVILIVITSGCFFAME